MADEQAAKVGDGVTLHERGGECVPGTVVRVSEGSVWFKLDQPRSPVPAANEWTYQADLTDEGVYRERHDKMLVEVGVRRAAPPRALPPPGRRSAADLAEAVKRMEPSLLKTEWPPMSYMAIPSVLASADALLAELDAFEGAEEDCARIKPLRGRLQALRTGFRRVV